MPMALEPEKDGADERLVVGRDGDGVQLLEFLSARLINESKARLRRLIGSGKIRLNGSAAGTGRSVSAGDIVCLPPGLDRSPPAPQTVPIEVTYDGPDHLCINKPAGQTVLPGRGGEGADFHRSLVALLNADAPPGGPYVRPHTVHRLDRDTSGVLLVARNVAAGRALSLQFQHHEVEKTYLGIVEGPFPRREVTLDVPIARRPGSVVEMAPSRRGRPAVTLVAVRERFGHFTLLEIHPRTGRQHQIRVHLAAAGYPLTVDPLYGRRKGLTGGELNAILGREVASAGEIVLNRCPLHASAVSYRAPLSGEPMTHVAPLPSDLKALLDLLRGADPAPERR